MTTPKRRRPVGETIGGILVGFDQQVFRATKPIPELIESAKPIPPVPAKDGGTIEVGLPPDLATPATSPGRRPTGRGPTDRP